MPFSESEMIPRGVVKGARGRIDLPLYSAPITAKENMKMAMLEKKALFLPNYRYFVNFTPRAIPDNEARGFCFDGAENPHHPEGFPDMLGTTWLFIEQVGGSMVKPGNPVLSDMNEWEEKIVFPDVDSWPWEKQKEISKDYMSNPELAYTPTILSGYFERLISLLDFEGAAMALIDEDQQDAVKAFLDRMADVYIKIIDRLCDDYPQIDGFTVHDDWGSQRAPFFSLDAAMEMLVPAMKKVADHIHARGKFYDMHCCGQVEALLPAMIEIGVDCWSGQPMNDKRKLYHQYGDKIMIGVDSDPVPADMPEEEVAKMAKDFVNEFFVPGKYAMLGYNSPIQNPKFFEYLYRYSRMKAEGQEI